MKEMNRALSKGSNVCGGFRACLDTEKQYTAGDPMCRECDRDVQRAIYEAQNHFAAREEERLANEEE